MLEITKKCLTCETDYNLLVPPDRYYRWLRGEGLIQEMLPELSADERELLLTGMCGKCFDEVFKDLEEEDDE